MNYQGPVKLVKLVIKDVREGATCMAVLQKGEANYIN